MILTSIRAILGQFPLNGHRNLVFNCAAGLSVGLAATNIAPLHAQDSGETAEEARDGGLLGDEFARDTGAIIVTGQRLGESNLFEPVVHPEASCLANAPGVGEDQPGFTIDASGLKRVRQLERIRRKTRAGTIYVSRANLVGEDFRKAKLYDMCFFDSGLSQTNWSGLSAQGLGFVNTDLTGANMANTHLPSVLFRDVKLGLVDARGARWMQGRLDGGWDGSLRELDLTGADLTDFRFVCGTAAEDGCPIERGGIVMNDANLRRASLHSFYVGDLALTNARIDQTELSLDHLSLVEDARLVGPIVLRSPRRAVMLFPGEVAQLTKVAATEEAQQDVCADAQTGFETAENALAIVCDIPGSETRELLRSVAMLEERAQNIRGYGTAREKWVASRDACLDLADSDQRSACIVTSYRTRQTALRADVGRPQWLEDRGYRLFLSREAAFPTDEGEPGLYGRILPVLLDTALAAVMVYSDGRGGLHAKGVAAEGCYFEQEDLFYDVEQAQIGFGYRTRRRAPVRMEDPLVAIAGRSATVEADGLTRAAPACGGENPFPRLEEITLDERMLASIWERF